MRRTNLDEGLQELNARVIHLGSLIEQALTKTFTSLERDDFTSLAEVIEANSRIETGCVDAEKRALRLLLLQQPLAGQDMRFLTAILHISSDLSRISDTIVEIAQTILKIVSLSTAGISGTRVDHHHYSIPKNAIDQYGNMTDAFIVRGLIDLSKEITYRLQQTLEAFASRDTTIAKNIGTEHDLLDARYLPLCNDILNMQTQISALSTLQYDPSIVQRSSYFLWIAHKLEQIANYLNSICKRIIFIAEG